MLLANLLPGLRALAALTFIAYIVGALISDSRAQLVHPGAGGSAQMRGSSRGGNVTNVARWGEGNPICATLGRGGQWAL